ncbi:DUF6270 domain-containing protein [Cellulosimicrobium cellulans]|uniref:DUF6270 domain-containing protein n=1 Tax=Cellulosimicrobium cellulans TaxID=1710 RepID=UPI00130D9EB2|nr:DUF6270 domain-containing protein [Cellulosimicrobium cellulans]
MSAPRMFVYGSDLARAVAERLEDPGGPALLGVVARQSLLSAYSRPVTLVAPPPLPTRSRHRWMRGDYGSNLEHVLAGVAGTVDLVLVDLADEVLGVHVLPDGSVVTRTEDLVVSGAEERLPAGTRHLPLGDPTHLEHWDAAADWLAALLRRTTPGARVVLLDGQDDRLRPYLARAAAALGAEVARVPDRPSSGDHAAVVEHLARALGTASEPAPEPAPGPATEAAPAAAPATPRTPLDPRAVVAATWRMRRADGSNVVGPLRLLADGTIWGHAHRNEATWEVDDAGVLVLRDRDGRPSTRFDSAVVTAGGLRLEGPFVLRPADGIRHVLETIEMDWQGRRRPSQLTRRLLREEAERHGWSIGDHTCGKPTVRGAGSAPLTIGRFTSIDERVTLILGHRPADAVSTYPFRTLHDFWPGARALPANRPTAGPVRIGHDVWLGEGTTVLPGVTVGDGSVVAPGSLLMHDVEPYAVVAGSPGRQVSRRFSDRQVAGLLSARWWDWDDERVDALLPLMFEDVDLFLDAALRP